MSLSVSLNNALSGLNVNQQALSVLSQNIANANTQGYSRKNLNQTSNFVDGVGLGVRIEDIGRKIDSYLRDAVQNQSAALGRNEVARTFTDRIQVLLGQPGSGNGIDAAIEGFFNNLQSLAETPEVGSFRVNAVNSGISLARQLSTLSSELFNLRYEADRQIKLNVDQINSDLRNIYSLNAAIVTSSKVGKSSAELMDKRDALVSSITQRIKVTVTYNSDESIALTTPGGISLLDTSLYEIDYSSAPNSAAFISDSTLAPMRVYAIDNSGNRVSTYQELTTAAPSSSVQSRIGDGSIKGLIDMRDSSIPDILEQLDSIAAKLRDGINAIHNAGSSFPPATLLTGTRLVSGQETMQWTGAVRLAVIDTNGRPVTSGYAGDAAGKPPLNMDISFLNGGDGKGYPKVQTIIDEINSYYGVPQARVEVGNLKNIQLVTNTQTIPNNNNTMNFDFDLQNISSLKSKFFVTDLTVKDENGVTLAAPTHTFPRVALDDTNTFTTAAGSAMVTVAAANHGLSEGQRIYMPQASAAVNGIPAASFNGYFKVGNITEDSFDIELVSEATSGGSVNDAGLSLNTAYHEIEPGSQERTRDSGTFTADFSANTTSSYYSITATVGVDDGTAVTPSTITYRVYNNSRNLLNNRYAVESVAGAGVITAPSTTKAYLRAMLVDAQGNELPKTGGNYSADAYGYLKIESTSGYTFAIDELNSRQNGLLLGDKTHPGTGRGFSHFFELNNFFNSNRPIETGDTLRNSAINFSVAERLRSNPALISLGTLTGSPTPAGAFAPPYTYERNIGDNSIIQRLAKFGLETQGFLAAGGLAAASLTVSGYASQVLGYNSAIASRAKLDEENTKVTLSGFQQRSDAVSGVNLDEELANTIIYQNAYTASARIITVTNQLFETLLNIGQ